jgi:hypothetical protein
MSGEEADKGTFSTRSFYTATVDLDPSATEALKRPGWLDNAQPVSQMTVNEACTHLIRHGLSVGLSSRPSST